ncbi:sialate O-acetylesterase [uncultured Lactobacillus sp.]|uniref:sialate O-acetylesterase n=1 Tax=uncultured Lactobacillus sp. TaxID=153152 RepID=UPI0026314F72|nr:sialate O-acetylesterase [uncultured Lactobacillus sp.]
MKLNQNILADYFQDGMVLPRNKEFYLGGKVASESLVKISFNGKTTNVLSDDLGNWHLHVGAISNFNGEAEIKVMSNKHSQVIKNLHLGKVYLLSGQSNIEYRLKDEADFSQVKKDLDNCKYQNLYYYNVPQIDFLDSKTGKILPKDLKEETWHHVNSKNAGDMSAVGYYMLQKLSEINPHEPLAIVDCFKGGTSASVWIDKRDLSSDPELNEAFIKPYQKAIAGKTKKDFDQETKEYNLRVEKHNHDLNEYLRLHPDTTLSDAKNIVGHTPWPPPMRPELFTRPAGLHQTMMDQIKYGSFNMLIWYQGENDTDRAQYYHKLLPMLIFTWRKTLKDPSLPIKVIQLPGYADYPQDSAALIRQVQLDTSRQLTNADLVSFVDGGEEHNIHPTHKKKMGRRLGSIVSGRNYLGSPYVDKVIQQDKRILLHITRCESCKLSGKATIKLIGGQQSRSYEVQESDLNKNYISIPLKINDLRQISYGYENYPQNIGLYNELDYPLSPFKIEVNNV